MRGKGRTGELVLCCWIVEPVKRRFFGRRKSRSLYTRRQPSKVLFPWSRTPIPSSPPSSSRGQNTDLLCPPLPFPEDFARVPSPAYMMLTWRGGAGILSDQVSLHFFFSLASSGVPIEITRPRGVDLCLSDHLAYPLCRPWSSVPTDTPMLEDPIRVAIEPVSVMCKLRSSAHSCHILSSFPRCRELGVDAMESADLACRPMIFTWAFLLWSDTMV